MTSSAAGQAPGLDRPVAGDAVTRGAVSSGIARKVDDLGRIVLPVELRRLFGIRTGDALSIAVNGNDILLRKIEDHCVFCDGTQELRLYLDKQVCHPCAGAVGGLASGAQADGDVVHPTLGDAQLGGDRR